MLRGPVCSRVKTMASSKFLLLRTSLCLGLAGCASPEAEPGDSKEQEASASPNSANDDPESEQDSPEPDESPEESPGESQDPSTPEPEPSEQSPQESSKGSSKGSSKPDETPEESPQGECGDLPFDAAWLERRVSELSGAIKAKVDGKTIQLGERFTKEGRAKGRAWIRAQYRALGYEVSEHKFSRGVNVVATKAGKSEEFYVFSAHHDTVPNCPGADDDAAGITTVLAMAAALAPCDLEYSVRFVSFDQEENGLVGSAAYAGDLKKSGESKKMRGNVQVEMSAYDSDNDGSFNIIDCDDPKNQDLADSVKNAVGDENLALIPVHDCVTASDHSSFWDIGVPAIAVSQLFFGDHKDRTPCYHQSCDTVEILNFDYMNELSKGLAYSALHLVQAH